jgi:hypothetical protein
MLKQHLRDRKLDSTGHRLKADLAKRLKEAETKEFLKQVFLADLRMCLLCRCLHSHVLTALLHQSFNWPPGKDEVKTKHVKVTFTYSVIPPGRGSTPEPEKGWGRKYRRVSQEVHGSAMADPENAGTVKKVRIMCVGAVIDCFFLLNLQQPIGRRGKKVPCAIKCYESLSLCPCVEWQG